MDNIALAFLLTFIAGISTMLGSIFIFFKDNRGVVLKYSLSFASGVMLCVSIIDLIPESLTYLYNDDREYTFLISGFFIFIGLILSAIIEKVIPENQNYSNGTLYKVGIFSMIAIILHNIPEGIATFLSSVNNITIGIVLTIAIALHNIPEGISISVPVYKATRDRKKALLYTFISGMSEPLGAILAYLFLEPIVTDTIMGILLSIIAGIMTHISISQLLPTALKYKEKKKTLIFFIIGILFMSISHILMS